MDEERYIEAVERIANELRIRMIDSTLFGNIINLNDPCQIIVAAYYMGREEIIKQNLGRLPTK